MQLVVSARLQSWYVICSKIAILQKPCHYLWWNFLNSKFQIHDVLTEVVNLYFCIRKKNLYPDSNRFATNDKRFVIFARSIMVNCHISSDCVSFPTLLHSL